MEISSENQAVFMELQMLEQKMKQLEAQINAINKQTSEMHGIVESLKAIDASQGKEALLPIGKGIFIKSNLTSKNLLLNIGSGIVIEKGVAETIRLVDEQVAKLNEMALEYQQEIESAARNIEGTIAQLQNSQK
jgi:prefoldin alpha subunit